MQLKLLRPRVHSWFGFCCSHQSWIHIFLFSLLSQSPRWYLNIILFPIAMKVVLSVMLHQPSCFAFVSYSKSSLFHRLFSNRFLENLSLFWNRFNKSELTWGCRHLGGGRFLFWLHFLSLSGLSHWFLGLKKMNFHCFSVSFLLLQ